VPARRRPVVGSDHEAAMTVKHDLRQRTGNIMRRFGFMAVAPTTVDGKGPTFR
jgi:hypothetical protein